MSLPKTSLSKASDTETVSAVAAVAPAPIAHPLHRNAEARAIATAAGWPDACTDSDCARTGRCAGKLRSVMGGPASFPTCLQIVCRFLHDPDDLTLREASAALEFIRPGEGWSMQPMRADGETGWPPPDDEDDGPASQPDFLIAMMGLLGDREAGGEALAEGGLSRS